MQKTPPAESSRRPQSKVHRWHLWPRALKRQVLSPGSAAELEDLYLPPPGFRAHPNGQVQYPIAASSLESVICSAESISCSRELPLATNTVYPEEHESPLNLQLWMGHLLGIPAESLLYRGGF